MTKQVQKSLLILIVLTIGLSGCVNLKHVHDFSSSSLKSLKKFEEINYSFQQSCKDNCQDEKIINLDLSSESCHCKLNKEADKITLLIYKAISGYLKNLTKLSDNDLTNYKTDALREALPKGVFGSIKIEEDHVEAYTKLSEILLNAFTNKYRKNKIKKYVKDSNEPLKVLINFLDFNLSSNLIGKLNVQKERIKIYYFELIKDASLSTLEKRKAVEVYYSRLNSIETIEKELITYTKALKKISKGHQKMLDNIDDFNKEEIKEILAQYTSDIEDIISELDKLKK